MCIEMKQQCLDDDEADQATQGALSECSDLVGGTTCDIQCDYKRAIEICSDAHTHGVALPFQVHVGTKPPIQDDHDIDAGSTSSTC